MFYDSNNIQLSTKVEEVSTEDIVAKYEAWGWSVISIDGNDPAEIRQALSRAVAETEKPTLIVGDFDSHCNPHLDVETIVLPCEKDDTDTVFAVKTMVQRGYDDFLLIGVIGARLDHTLANLQSLAFLLRHRARGYLYDQNFVYTAIENETLTLTREVDWGIVSLFSMGDRAEHITLEGLQYPLTDGTIDCGFPLGVSNHIVAPTARITVGRGPLLVGWELPKSAGEE